MNKAIKSNSLLAARSKSQNTSFGNNKLINNNPHVKYNMNIVTNNSENLTNEDAIISLLRPQSIRQDNTDFVKNMNRLVEERRNKIPIKNTPYKLIIKDHIVQKPVDQIQEDDFIVHRVDKSIDANIDVFNNELRKKKQQQDAIDHELQVTFNNDNYRAHKKKFEYNENYIRNLGYSQENSAELKTDCIEFYKKKQRELEQEKKQHDEILRNLIDDGFINRDELPNSD